MLEQTLREKSTEVSKHRKAWLRQQSEQLQAQLNQGPTPAGGLSPDFREVDRLRRELLLNVEYYHIWTPDPRFYSGRSIASGESSMA